MPIETIINQSSVVSRQSSVADDETLTDSGFFWREKNGVKILVCRALEENGFANGFSTRLGGVSPFPENDLNLAGFDEDSRENIFENRRRFLNVFGGNFRFSSVWQVHGNDVKIVANEQDIENTEEKYDALCSNLENLLIGVKTADCVPVIVGDRSTNAYAAIHAGWRGTVESIVAKTIEKMRQTYGTDSKDLICAIGPAAGCKNYEVGADVIEAFTEKFSTCGKLFTPTREGHALIDLHTANKDQLLSVGVPEQNIFTAPFCTMERLDLFFSYRAEKKIYGKTGRLMSVIGRRGEEE